MRPAGKVMASIFGEYAKSVLLVADWLRYIQKFSVACWPVHKFPVMPSMIWLYVCMVKTVKKEKWVHFTKPLITHCSWVRVQVKHIFISVALSIFTPFFVTTTYSWLFLSIPENRRWVLLATAAQNMSSVGPTVCKGCKIEHILYSTVCGFKLKKHMHPPAQEVHIQPTCWWGKLGCQGIWSVSFSCGVDWSNVILMVSISQG